jgi:thiol-disulfide isomerase/thioredoxin
MIVIHIDSKNGDIEQFNKYINQGKQVFVLFYMEGCGPCNATRPEWKKIENILQHNNKYKNNNNIVIADIDQELSNKIPKLKKQPSGFPTMLYITNKGNVSEDYEESNIDTKDRSIDSFVNWIETKSNQQNGGKNKTKKRRTMKKTMLNKKGGKWSQKYKRSINCRKPKGFSQKQYCKYGRTK